MANIIDKVYVISLEDRHERWNEFSLINDSRITKYTAIDTRSIKTANNALSGGDRYLNPPLGVYTDYFSTCCGAIGCYLSHYNIWKEIVENNINYTLIVEDDAQVEDIEKVISIDTDKYKQFLGPITTHIKQLNHRTQALGHFYSGTESYLITLQGARRLLYLADNNQSFHNIIQPPSNNLNPPSDKFISFKFTRKGKCIWAPLDRFIGLCNDDNLSDDIRVSINIKPRVSLKDPLPRSDIFNIDIEQPHWLLEPDELKELRSTETYKWWQI